MKRLGLYPINEEDFILFLNKQNEPIPKKKKRKVEKILSTETNPKVKSQHTEKPQM